MNTIIGKKPSILIGGFLVLLITFFWGNIQNIRANTRINRITVEGAHFFSESEVTKILNWENGMEWDSTRGLHQIDTLKNYYHDMGFFNLKIQSQSMPRDSNRIDIELIIQEGERCRIHQIKLSGIEAYHSGKLQKQLVLKPGSYYSSVELTQDMERMVRYFEDRGYPFTTVSLTDFLFHDAISKTEVSILWEIDTVIAVNVTFIEAQGDYRTDSELLPRIMRLNLPFLYSQKRIDKASRLLRRVPFIAYAGKLR
ncbi:hypothetical protein JW877_07285, partial [bacterium]|nr:hypothetical protein [bacterium]